MKRAAARLKFTAAVLALALAACPALFAQDYEIRLHRPGTAGARCHLSAVGKESAQQLYKRGDAVLQDIKTEFTVEAELALTALAVNDKGRATQVKVEVEKLVRVEGDAHKELAPKGSVITVTWDGKAQVFEMAGGGLTPDIEKSLKLLDLIAYDPNAPIEDEVFGTKDRKKVGESWEANSDLLAKHLSSEGVITKKEDLKATYTLEKVVTVGKTECLQISGLIACDKLQPPLPNGLEVKKGEGRTHLVGKIPVDISRSLPAEGSMEMTMTVVASGKLDPSADEDFLKFTCERSLVTSATELK